MTNGGMSLAIAVDVREAQRGVKDLSGALDDTAGALDDLARDAQRSGDKVERALDDTGDAGKDAARDIEKGGERVERTFRDMVRDAGKAEKAVADIGDGAGRGLGEAGEAAGEFKREAISNFSEVTSSFDGSMSSIQDLAQGTLGGLAGSGLPGVTIAAGIAAAAVGLIGGAMEGNAEQEEAAADRAADWAQAYIDAGNRIIGAAHVVAEIQAIATDPEMYKQASADAEDWGVTVPLAMRAMAGDAAALAVVEETLAARAAEADKALAAQEHTTTSAAGAAFDLADSVDRGQESFNKLTGEMSAGAERADAVSEALLGMIGTAEGATEQVDELGNRLVTLPDDTQVVVQADTGRATLDVAAFKGDVDELASRPVVKRVRVEVDDAAWRNWNPPNKRGYVQASVGKTVKWE